MKNQKKIKLNMPCWICGEDLYLGTGLVSYPEDTHKSPAHLDCVLKECKSSAIKEVLEKMEDYEDILYNQSTKLMEKVPEVIFGWKKLKATLQEKKT